MLKIFYTDHYVLPLPTGHRFPMQKYARLRQRVEAAQLGEMCLPAPATDEDLCRAHDVDYVRRVVNGELTDKELRRIGFPWSPGMVERSRRSSGATIAACRTALSDGYAVNLAGGTHHAFRDHGGGYCVFNDSAVAARAVQAEGRVQRIIVIDCDVHQGDGTAAILAGDASVFTFSIHGANNYPLHKQHSDLDIELPDRADDVYYLEALDNGVRRAISLAGAELAIYLAGADPFEGDSLGKLAVSKHGLHVRDQIVYGHCRAAGLPVATTMAGGYGKQVDDTVDIHFQTVKLVSELAHEQETQQQH